MSDCEIARGEYKGQEAIVLENHSLRALILPGWGSKLASLYCRDKDYELLWQNPASEFRPTAYADPFENGEAAGFDEMFPTITRCLYEREPWTGVEMPDHGEVWSVPWRCTLTADSVELEVDGVRFAYTLGKRVRLDGDTLHIEYTLENRSKSELDFIWAAHPLFNTVEGMRMLVPADLDRIINSVPSRRLGGYGRMHRFPFARLGPDADIRPGAPGESDTPTAPRATFGHGFDLSTIPAKGSSDFQKYWFAEKLRQGWCILHDPRRMLNIGLAWPAETVAYLGIWVNEGGWFGQYNVAPEPATAAMDRVDASKMWNAASTLSAGERRQWWLTITVRPGEEPREGPL